MDATNLFIRNISYFSKILLTWTQHSVSQKLLVSLTVFCFLLTACEKEDSISIPDRLTGSEWSASTDPGTAVLKFTSDTQCVYFETSDDDITKEIHYQYRYAKPDLVLSSEDDSSVEIRGSIEQKDSKCIVLQLSAEDGSPFFVAYKSVYFQ